MTCNWGKVFAVPREMAQCGLNFGSLSPARLSLQPSCGGIGKAGGLCFYGLYGHSSHQLLRCKVES